MENRITEIKNQILKNFWGYTSFRDGQEPVIDAVIHRKDAFALLPTGGGKSICYQLPAMMMEGTCIVISPLLALMRDQVTQLQSMGAEAEYLSSELDEGQEEEVYNRCKEGITKILYISPERLKNQNFLLQIEEIQISFIAVDEAHCISEWGQDFRTGYENISEFRKMFPHVSCLALTATATAAVFQDIIRKLNLQNPFIARKTFRRENLKIIHIEISDKYEFITSYLKNNTSSGLIYTRTRAEAENLAKFLSEKGLSNVDYFHAGLAAREKHRKQAEWQNSDRNILISTNAFGMGIDKDNVRFVIHLAPPASIENYYQEIGRAGRDALPADAILLWNPQEIKQIDNIIANQIPTKQDFIKTVQYLYSMCQIADGEYDGNWHNYSLQRIHNYTRLSPAAIKNIITFLHNQEVIFNKDYKAASTVELKFQPKDIDLLSPKDAHFSELLLRSLPGLHQGNVAFSETALAQKLNSDAGLIKQRLDDLQTAGLISYTNGNLASIRFLKPRDDRSLFTYYLKLFQDIQNSKVRKWEEMKFLLRNNSVCKMKLILSYFDENKPENCGICSICERRQQFFNPKNVPEEIKKALQEKPASLESIAAKLSHVKKECLLENLILLLDSGEVKMQDFRTYTLG